MMLWGRPPGVFHEIDDETRQRLAAMPDPVIANLQFTLLARNQGVWRVGRTAVVVVNCVVDDVPFEIAFIRTHFDSMFTDRDDPRILVYLTRYIKLLRLDG